MRTKNGNAPTRRGPDVGDWLCLAAAPTFAGMAWLSTGDATALCSSGSGMPPMGGMASMFLLMSFFHLPPWLKLVSRRREIVSCNRIEGD